MDFIKPYQSEIIVGLAVLILVQFALIFGLNTRLGYIRKTLRTLLTGPNGDDLEGMLRRCLEESGKALQRGDELENRLSTLGLQMQGCVQRVGLVRYDAYGDVSGKQSFSIALLDGRDNGALITGLFGRNDGRCYGKAIVQGQTEQGLTDEEAAALRMALEGGVADGTINLTPANLNGKRRSTAR